MLTTAGWQQAMRRGALHKARWLPQARTDQGALTAALPGLLLVKPEEPHHLGSNLPSTNQPAKGFDFFLLQRKCRLARLRRQIGLTLPSPLAPDGGYNSFNNDSTKGNCASAIASSDFELAMLACGTCHACKALHPSLMLFVPRPDPSITVPGLLHISPAVLYLLPFFFGATTL
jgi:hypothetical protein